MSAIDRLSDDYEPRFDIDAEIGSQGELYVANMIDTLRAGNGSVEVKTDARIAQTGNVYIEYECRYNGEYKPSGIASTQADIWVFVLPANVVIAAPTDSVRQLARECWASNKRECTRGDHPTRGVAVPVGEFVSRLYRYEVTS